MRSMQIGEVFGIWIMIKGCDLLAKRMRDSVDSRKNIPSLFPSPTSCRYVYFHDSYSVPGHGRLWPSELSSVLGEWRVPWLPSLYPHATIQQPCGMLCSSQSYPTPIANLARRTSS